MSRPAPGSNLATLPKIVAAQHLTRWRFLISVVGRPGGGATRGLRDNRCQGGFGFGWGTYSVKWMRELVRLHFQLFALNLLYPYMFRDHILCIVESHEDRTGTGYYKAVGIAQPSFKATSGPRTVRLLGALEFQVCRDLRSPSSNGDSPRGLESTGHGHNARVHSFGRQKYRTWNGGEKRVRRPRAGPSGTGEPHQ